MSVLTFPGSRTLTLTNRTHIMGILNSTPDSFYPGSRTANVAEGLARAREMIAAGADVLDIGGESTRPGSDSVDADEEYRRVVPLIEAIREESDIPISVDTRKRKTAEAALDAGADMVNDVSALRDDTDLAVLVAERGVPVVLMHMRGTPKTMQHDPHYDDTVNEIERELGQFVEQALEAGIDRDQIILDPGIGFGKTVSDNLRILRHLDRFRAPGFPLLLGASRKSFIGNVLGGGDSSGRAVDGRLAGTLAVHAYAVFHGVELLRVHDVRETADVRNLLEAIAGA